MIYLTFSSYSTGIPENPEITSGITFPGGERHIRVPIHRKATAVTVDVQAISVTDIMDLLLVKNALDAEYPSAKKTLLMKYLPYARQDRIAVEGEAHSLKVICDLITSMNFDEVIIWDSHSYVAEALLPIGKTKFVYQHDLLTDTLNNLPSVAKDFKIDYIVSPDAGAEKKIYASADLLGLSVINAYKKRDPKTGKLSDPRIMLVPDNMNGKNLLIVDDICDGGYTSIQLANVIKGMWPKSSISLYVTHGIFSKGLEPFKGIIDSILCPNVLNQDLKASFVNNFTKI